MAWLDKSRCNLRDHAILVSTWRDAIGRTDLANSRSSAAHIKAVADKSTDKLLGGDARVLVICHGDGLTFFHSLDAGPVGVADS